MRTTALWTATSNSAPLGAPTVLEPVWWTASDGRLIRDAGVSPTSAAVLLIPLSHEAAPSSARRGPPCAVLLVPEHARGLLLNGVRCMSGTHLLQHADLLELGEQRLWITVDVTPDELAYEPGPEGAACCARLKTRLQPGEPVVRCAGTPRTPCGRLYRARAWEAGLTCECGFVSDAPERWSPPLPLPSRSELTDALLACSRE